MIGLFKRVREQSGAVPAAAGLGAHLVALPLPAGCTVPRGCTGVVVTRSGQVRRVAEGVRLAPAEGETAWAFHPGPYTADLVPFEAAPEIGLRVVFAVDSPDPRVAQQRFDLYLASEGAGPLELAALVQSIEQALQRELAQGGLDLPPCTGIEEWNAFRTGFNQLLYVRFGLVVDECVPVDLGGERDFARMLLARAEPQAPSQASADTVQPQASPFDPAAADAQALRRLFLELPCVMGRLRAVPLPAGQDLFRVQQALLRRLDLASLAAGTMPALGLLAPSVPLAPAEQARRARHCLRAVAALDEAWALLARFGRAESAQCAQLFDAADRIVANLELDLAARRLAVAEGEPA